MITKRLIDDIKKFIKHLLMFSFLMFKEALFLIMQKIIKIFYQLINLMKLLKNLLIKKL